MAAPDNDDRLVNMTDAVLDCREGRHTFPPLRSCPRRNIREHGRDVTHAVRKCKHCKSVRNDVYDRFTKETVRRWYVLADGYDGYAEPGQGRVSRQAVLHEIERRYPVGDE